MIYKFQADPRAIAAGLMMPPVESSGEPLISDAGLLAMVGSIAYSTEIDDDTRRHNLNSLTRVLAAAKSAGLDQWADEYLINLFSESFDPLGDDDKGKLLAVLCRLVSLTLGQGRISQLLCNAATH